MVLLPGQSELREGRGTGCLQLLLVWTLLRGGLRSLILQPVSFFLFCPWLSWVFVVAPGLSRCSEWAGCPEPCGILFSEPKSSASESGSLTTGPPEKSSIAYLLVHSF